MDTSEAGLRPVFDLPDRMRKGMRVSGHGVPEMADYLGVTAVTVRRWLNGQTNPDLRTLRLWASRSGVALDWLIGEDDDAGVTRAGHTSTVK